jgi:ribosomal protein S18 acetylase RimI-like enzyme
MEIRPPHSHEMPAISALLAANGWAHRVHDDAWLGRLVAVSRALVAVESGEVIGFARAVTDGLSNGYLSMLVVAETHRRRGVGSRLVRAIMGGEPGVTWVLRASRPGAREFFDRLGFRPSSDAMERNRERVVSPDNTDGRPPCPGS